ncbi:conjugal transfer protein [Enterococcus faecalis]|uniref:conjugal transfer protein n=1 Tax=Enterococcus faecalis TaxID=1351 RepID=UPI001A970B0E|nr:conjugal transfer protein [Enterococcus faecalis]MBO1135747.1 conjugal transfer protein [Enterococcus faecalis]
MKFFKRKKIPKQERLVDKKEISPKTARIVFLSALGLMVATIPLSFLMAKNANVNATQNKDNLVEIQKQLSSEADETLNEFLAQRYLNQFITVYMNKPSDEEALSKREKELSTFYVNKLPKEGETKVSQKLVSSSFFSFDKQGKEYLAKYVVTYEVNYPVEKERTVTRKEGDKTISEKQKYKEQEKTERTVLLTIPFIQKNNQFKVVSLPYYSTIPSLKAGNVDGKAISANSFDRVDEKEEAKLKDFLKQFYQLYASDDIKQMSYMMEKPEVLGKGFSVEMYEPAFYKDGEKYLIIDTPIIYEGNNGNNHKEYIVLTVVRQSDKFYIEKLSHDLGGVVK